MHDRRTTVLFRDALRRFGPLAAHQIGEQVRIKEVAKECFDRRHVAEPRRESPEDLRIRGGRAVEESVGRDDEPVTLIEGNERGQGRAERRLRPGHVREPLHPAPTCAHLDNLDYRTYVLLGDGECAEGAVWEAAALAGFYHLNNLIAGLGLIMTRAAGAERRRGEGGRRTRSRGWRRWRC